MIENAISRLRHYLVLVPLRFEEIPEDLQSQRPAPEKWSKKEILGHLIDSALHNWRRMAIAKDTTGPYNVQFYQQAESVRNNGYQDLPASHITQLWKNMNQQIVEVCQRLGEMDLKKEIHLPAPYNSDTDLAFLINDYVDHLEHHLKQIFGSLEELERSDNWQISVAQASEALAQEEAQRYVVLKKRGDLSVEYYAPKGIDPQQPHRQDELYVIISGSGQFYCDGKRQDFAVGDVLFVPAGVDHRFENFSEDFSTWVIFYGPEGGAFPQDQQVLSERKIGDQNFQISTHKDFLNLDIIASFLQNSYWANGRSKEDIQRSLDNCLNFGIYQKGQQVGLARVVTDYGTFAYLADVFVLEEYRGLGLGKWLMEKVMEHPDLQKVKWSLVTKDAHRLYEQFGFRLTDRAEKIMEKPKPSL